MAKGATTGETGEHYTSHRLLDLTREWSIHGDDIFQVVGTDQALSPLPFQRGIAREEIVEQAQGNLLFPSWAHLLTFSILLVSTIWLLTSRRAISSIKNGLVRSFFTYQWRSKEPKGNSRSPTNTPQSSDEASAVRITTTTTLAVNQHTQTLSPDELVTLALTEATPTISPTTQILPIPTELGDSTFSLVSTEESRQSTMQAAREVVSAASIMEQVLEESGRPHDAAAALNWAMSLQRTSSKLQAQRQKEYRRYSYDSWQRETDRELDDQRHCETLASMEKANEWVETLVKARDRCLASISTAIVRGVTLVTASRMLGFLFLNPNVSLSNVFGMLKIITESMCACSDTASTSVVEATSSIYTTFQTISMSYLFVSEGSGWSFAFCHLLCMAKTLSGIVCVLTFCLGLRWIGCPLFVTTFIISSLGGIAVTRNIAIAIPDINRLIAVQAIVSCSAFAYVAAKFYSVRRNLLLSQGNPQSALLNKVLLWFDDANIAIQLSPIVLVAVAVLRQLPLV